MAEDKKTPASPPITAEWLSKVKAKLQSLPPLPQTIFTRQEAITELAPYIDDAKKQRYRIEDLLPFLNVDGQKFTAAAVKTGLARAKETTPADAAPAQTTEQISTAARSRAGKTAVPMGNSAKSKPITIEGQVADPMTSVGDEATLVRSPNLLHPPTPDDDLL